MKKSAFFLTCLLLLTKTADGAVSPGLAESIKVFVELTAKIHLDGFNEEYVKVIQEVLTNIDAEIETRVKDQVNVQIYMLDLKQQVLQSSNEVHLLEGSGSGRAELVRAREKRQTLGNQYRKFSDRLELAQSLITVCKQVRELIGEDLDGHLEGLGSGAQDPRPLEANSERMMLRLAPLIKRAVGLTTRANQMIEEDKNGEIGPEDPEEDDFEGEGEIEAEEESEDSLDDEGLSLTRDEASGESTDTEPARDEL